MGGAGGANGGEPCVTVDDCKGATLCNTAACDNGTCVYTEVDVNDNDACTVDSCDSQTGGAVHMPVNVDDANACTEDTCDSATGKITHNAIGLDDQNECTNDSCDPCRRCSHLHLLRHPIARTRLRQI